MGFQIEDGSGKGYSQKVNKNLRAYVNSLGKTENEAAVKRGDAYNLNTGTMTFTADATLGAVWLKNNEDENLIIEAIAVAVGYPSTQDQTGIMTLVRNPTGGTVFSEGFSTGVMNQNRNFGSSKTLNADFYIADGDGKTISGGDDIAQFFIPSIGRNFFNIGWELTKGDVLGIEMIPPDDSSNTFYIAIICHLQDADE